MGEQLRHVLGELDEPGPFGAVAGEAEAVPAAPERGLDGVELGPATGAFPVEFRRLGEDVQRAVDGLAQLARFEEQKRRCPRREQRPAVVGGIARVPLGIDGQPRLAFGAQDVAGVEVAVEEGVRLVAPQFADGRPRGGQRVPGQCVRQLAGVLAQPLLPGVCLVPQPGQTGRGGNGQPVAEPPGDRRHLVAVLDVRQGGGGPGPLQQHGEPRVVALPQPDGSAPVPRRERVRLMDVAGVGERHLQHGRLPGGGALRPSCALRFCPLRLFRPVRVLGSPPHRHDDPDPAVQDPALRYA